MLPKVGSGNLFELLMVDFLNFGNIFVSGYSWKHDRTKHIILKHMYGSMENITKNNNEPLITVLSKI